jgi:hypothetical protein
MVAGRRSLSQQSRDVDNAIWQKPSRRAEELLIDVGSGWGNWHEPQGIYFVNTATVETYFTGIVSHLFRFRISVRGSAAGAYSYRVWRRVERFDGADPVWT